MTREEIMALEPGPEMDAAVGRIMGHEILGLVNCNQDPEVPGWYHVPCRVGKKPWSHTELRPVYVAHCMCDLKDDHDDLDPREHVDYWGHQCYCLEAEEFYSTDIAGAWMAVEWVRSQGFSVRYRFMLELRGLSLWPESERPWRIEPFWWFMLKADSAEAICRAALLACGEGE